MAKKKAVQAPSKFKLSATQANQIGELRESAGSIDRTLRVALDHHTTRKAELQRAESRFWAELADQFDLDLENEQYGLTQEGGSVYVIQLEKQPEPADEG